MKPSSRLPNEDWTNPTPEPLSWPVRVGTPEWVVDRELGRLLERFDARPLRDRTLGVFHADHGESLGEQGYIGHGMLLNDATMRIPLVLRFPPRIPAGTRVDAQVRNVDILPTVLDVLALPIPEQASGASLLPLVEGGPGVNRDDLPERVAYMETYYTAHAAFAPPVRPPTGKAGSSRLFATVSCGAI